MIMTTTKQNELSEWVWEEATMLEFTAIISKSDNDGNGRNAFVILICEKGGP